MTRAAGSKTKATRAARAKRRPEHASRPRRPAFSRFANATSRAIGHPAAFIAAVALIVLWGISGPIFGWSETWQLVINTGTTIVTFLIVFLIQHSQNRDAAAMQLKLDELIRASEHAHNATLDLEELTQEELEELRDRYEGLAARARQKLREGREDTGIEPFDPLETKER